MMDRDEAQGRMTASVKFKPRDHFVSISTPTFLRATSTFFR